MTTLHEQLSGFLVLFYAEVALKRLFILLIITILPHYSTLLKIDVISTLNVCIVTFTLTIFAPFLMFYQTDAPVVAFMMIY